MALASSCSRVIFNLGPLGQEFRDLKKIIDQFSSLIGWGINWIWLDLLIKIVAALVVIIVG